MASNNEDAVAAGIIGLLLCLAALVPLGFQTYVWAKTGHWPPITIIGLTNLFFDIEWAKHPTDWLGIHGALNSTHPSVVLFALGFLMIYVAVSD